jgi:hypothetical protein
MLPQFLLFWLLFFELPPKIPSRLSTKPTEPGPFRTAHPQVEVPRSHVQHTRQLSWILTNTCALMATSHSGSSLVSESATLHEPSLLSPPKSIKDLGYEPRSTSEAVSPASIPATIPATPSTVSTELAPVSIAQAGKARTSGFIQSTRGTRWASLVEYT